LRDRQFALSLFFILSSGILNNVVSSFKAWSIPNKYLMSHYYFPSQVSARARTNYMDVLSELENYQLPTNNTISVEEVVNQKLYSWYLQEQQEDLLILDDAGWFMNYE
jgi:hypothetical protein